MDLRDEWFALDKLQHVIACLLIAICVSAVVSQSRHRFLRRWSTSIGCLSALVAGAAKELGDELGFWESAGASFKDGVADVLGVFLAAVILFFRRMFSGAEKVAVGGEISMV